jgi:hypothetical protein
MTIRFYDVEIEEMREATQEDWDLRHQRLVELTNQNARLRNRLILAEARQATVMGTLEPPAGPDAPFTVTASEPTTPR